MEEEKDIIQFIVVEDGKSQDTTDGWSTAFKFTGKAIKYTCKGVGVACTGVAFACKKAYKGYHKARNLFKNPRHEIDSLIEDDSMSMDQFKKKYKKVCDLVNQLSDPDSIYLGLIKYVHPDKIFPLLSFLLDLHADHKKRYPDQDDLRAKKIVKCYAYFLGFGTICGVTHLLPNKEQEWLKNECIDTLFGEYLTCTVTRDKFKKKCRENRHYLEESDVFERLLEMMYAIITEKATYLIKIKAKSEQLLALMDSQTEEISIDDHIKETGLDSVSHDLLFGQKIVILIIVMINGKIKDANKKSFTEALKGQFSRWFKISWTKNKDEFQLEQEPETNAEPNQDPNELTLEEDNETDQVTLE